MNFLFFVVVLTYLPIAVYSLVCFQCNLPTTNTTGDGQCAITFDGPGAVASIVECAAGEVCYTEMATGRGCRAAPPGFTDGVAVIGRYVFCSNADLCNNGPLFNLICYFCSQDQRLEDCYVNEVNLDKQSGPRVERRDCEFGEYCNSGYQEISPSFYTGIHRRCVTVSGSPCQRKGCDSTGFGGEDCDTCCSTDLCNTVEGVPEPIECYLCAQTGSDAEAKCAINAANINTAVTLSRCDYSEDVCLTRKETSSSGETISFIRMCLSSGKCYNSTECNGGSGGVCSQCGTTSAPTLPYPTSGPTNSSARSPTSASTCSPTNGSTCGPVSGSSTQQVWLLGLILLAAIATTQALLF